MDPAVDSDPLPRYRVEHRQPRRSTVLGVLVGPRPHWRELDPYVSRLIHDGGTGWVALVDDETGAVVVRRAVARRASAPPAFAPAGKRRHSTH